ncbi:LOW QUALITY PROTEIN: spindle and kinetochore-associated protein 3 [Dryobates pubescens]|uniref:LOW QUALITY PROTEIN: spindle and kinetochore-associated protein 3 n=1 Tax=Dryobates pubescens TaxID=118200 RepID=UPI0023B9D9EA|nr:LOW QUALITY PROTEIN: spindle and kinetochore-associated protein 3 [Dryobates pubescens]
MDVSRGFFSDLRNLCLRLEKAARELDQALRRQDTDNEDESPVSLLHDLHSEIKTLKEDFDASLCKSYSSKQAIDDFMKENEMLMQRNASCLGKIREVFQNYNYNPPVTNSTEENKEDNSCSAESVQSKSDGQEADDAHHPPACTEKPLVPKDLLREPQLSDFGLSQYAFSRPWSAAEEQPQTKACQEHDSNNRTPLKSPAPSVLPKTPKCRLKMEDYECATPKLEHFGISEHTMCMNEDYTMSLIQKTAQAVKKWFVKNVDHEMKIAEVTPRRIMVTPKPKQKVPGENAAADWTTSPMIFVFCTPDVKHSPKTNSTVSSRSTGTNELPPPSRMETPRCPDFETRWLVREAKVQVPQREKMQSATKKDTTNEKPKEDRIPFAVRSDNYLKRFGDPSPPKIKSYDELLDTPPPPELTRIPDDVLQILSKYNHKADSSTDKEMETKARSTTRYESDSTTSATKRTASSFSELLSSAGLNQRQQECGMLASSPQARQGLWKSAQPQLPVVWD